MRPFMYATDWSYQYEIIDERVNEYKSKQNEVGLLGDNLREGRNSGKSVRSARSHKASFDISINVILPLPQEQS
jgi:hypothetical protein